MLNPLFAPCGRSANLFRMWLVCLPLSFTVLSSAGAASATTASCYRPKYEAQFPLRVSADRRYLVDSQNQPFLLTGDTGWSLIAGLTREDADLYLTDRYCRGFNAVLVSLLEHKFVNAAPRNAYGVAPFKDETDFSLPNKPYFAQADWVIDRAEKLGMLVLLAPAYLGVTGGDEGWYRSMKMSGVEKLRRYGEYIGKFFARHKNIIWVYAGDYDPPDRRLVIAIEEGIREFDKTSLRTAHPERETSARSYWEDQPWLDINSIYSYRPIRSMASDEYAISKPMPFILIESAYENEHGATEQSLRAQAYQALLSGACGQVFGNNPIWHFDGPGLFVAPSGWQQQLASRGALSMTYIRKLFDQYRWWEFVPNQTLISHEKEKDHHPPIALSKDHTLAFVYSTAGNELTIDLRQMSRTKIKGRWFDPSSGTVQPARLVSNNGTFADFKVPGRNSAGYDDWILIVQSGPIGSSSQLETNQNTP